MQAEAQPLVNKFGLSETTPLGVGGKGLPWVVYQGFHKHLRIYVVCPGKDPSLGRLTEMSLSLPGVDCVGTVPSSLVTFASIQALHPDILINARTCGAFKLKGANIGDVFLASHLLFHHRRIPIPMFDLYGVGLRQAFSTPNLLKDLNLKGAAVAYVAELLKVPVMFLKAVTDLIDGDKPTAEEFLQNLSLVTSALEETATHQRENPF